jgi:periplasmic divalent cation tolerance protein
MLGTFVILCMCDGREEASRIAHRLVEERLAACVSILPAVESIYRWQEKIETAHETPLLIKTTPDRFPALEKRIVELHSYVTPEIVALPVVAGLESYLRWVNEQVS